MRRTITLAAFFVAAAALTACSSPTAPTVAATCANAKVPYATCPSKDYIDPAGDYIDPAGDYIDPAGDYIDPAGDYIDPAGNYVPPSN